MRKFFQYIKSLFGDLIFLIYPNSCQVCNNSLMKGEESICLKCISDMPFTTYHNNLDNPVNQLFWGKLQVEMATALFFFAKGSKYRNLLHSLKYRHKPEIGVFLGRELGFRIRNSEYFKNIDYLIPVPLHKSRLKERGYNQSTMICRGISDVTEIELYEDAIVRTVATQTQTKKNREERWENVAGKFALPNVESLKNKHVLLVDDVITTGATLEAVAHTLLEVEGLKISIAVLAKA
ncbi:MAG: ComF family protein [Bacteroidales bacterium]|nr:ComF family protein [Bacteroidales bacterium]